MHDSAQALRGKKLLLVGFTLFSMFFGAGNLIFPPFLGAQAGTALWLAFAGFAVSAIGLPIAGVAAVARAGGLSALAGQVHPRFAQVFAVLVYLSIGPCLAIPRTASTSFEMLTPLVGRSTPGQFLYSLVFFAAAYFVALKPEKLTQRLGRILCPALLVLIVVLFAGCILRPAAPGYGTPAEAYAALPAAQGVLDGYQTMDALAALNFGAVIALNLQAVGITEESAVRRGTIRAGFIAGGMLLVVYAMLTHIGGISGAAFPGSDTGAAVLTALADDLFGRVGQVLLAAIFVIACFNTCVGLIASVGEYFHELLPRLPYPAIAAFFALMSMLLANIGLADILRLSVPVLNAIYPHRHHPHRGGVPARTVPAGIGLAAGYPLHGHPEHPCRPALRPPLHLDERSAPEQPRLWLAAAGPHRHRRGPSDVRKTAARLCGSFSCFKAYFAELRIAAMTLRRTDGSV